MLPFGYTYKWESALRRFYVFKYFFQLFEKFFFFLRRQPVFELILQKKIIQIVVLSQKASPPFSLMIGGSDTLLGFIKLQICLFFLRYDENKKEAVAWRQLLGFIM